MSSMGMSRQQLQGSEALSISLPHKASSNLRSDDVQPIVRGNDGAT